ECSQNSRSTWTSALVNCSAPSGASTRAATDHRSARSMVCHGVRVPPQSKMTACSCVICMCSWHVDEAEHYREWIGVYPDGSCAAKELYAPVSSFLHRIAYFFVPMLRESLRGAAAAVDRSPCGSIVTPTRSWHCIKACAVHKPVA